MASPAGCISFIRSVVSRSRNFYPRLIKPILGGGALCRIKSGPLFFSLSLSYPLTLGFSSLYDTGIPALFHLDQRYLCSITTMGPQSQKRPKSVPAWLHLSVLSFVSFQLKRIQNLQTAQTARRAGQTQISRVQNREIIQKLTIPINQVTIL